MLDRAYADDLRLAAGLPRVRTTLNLLHRLILSLDGSSVSCAGRNRHQHLPILYDMYCLML